MTSSRRTRAMARKSSTLIIETAATTISAPSAAFGSRAIRRERKSKTTSTAAALTHCAIWLRAPAALATAVCDVPPPAGSPPTMAEARLAAPSATSS